MTNNLEWDLRYLELARQISLWSKDPSTKVGALTIGAEGQILSQGYNGFPRGVEDLPERLNDRETKYNFVVHAEMNCIYNACLSGVSLKGSTMYVYGLPICHKCTPGIIQVGVKRVVMASPNSKNDTIWLESFKISSTMLNESGVDYESYGYDDDSNWLNTTRLISRS